MAVPSITPRAKRPVVEGGHPGRPAAGNGSSGGSIDIAPSWHAPVRLRRGVGSPAAEAVPYRPRVQPRTPRQPESNVKAQPARIGSDVARRPTMSGTRGCAFPRFSPVGDLVLKRKAAAWARLADYMGSQQYQRHHRQRMYGRRLLVVSRLQ